MRKALLAAVLPLFMLAACGSTPMQPAGAAPAKMADGMLVNAKGLALYTFDRDVANSGKSACNGDCAVKWPPHPATASDRPVGDYTIVKRDDGRLQWAYRGKPLYSWPEDQEPGDKYGDNYNKVWHIVK
jgi:predicted lipoprotein with Yx(FWY)xxD motif